MARHAGRNWISAAGFGLRVTGLAAHQPALIVTLIPNATPWFTGGFEGPEGSLPCTLVLAAAIGFLVWRWLYVPPLPQGEGGTNQLAFAAVM